MNKTFLATAFVAALSLSSAAQAGRFMSFPRQQAGRRNRRAPVRHPVQEQAR